jgi:hypothetical protein
MVIREGAAPRNLVPLAGGSGNASRHAETERDAHEHRRRDAPDTSSQQDTTSPPISTKRRDDGRRLLEVVAGVSIVAGGLLLERETV